MINGIEHICNSDYDSCQLSDTLIPKSVWDKTATAVKKLAAAILVCLGTFLGNVLTCGTLTFIALWSASKRVNIQTQVEEKRIEHLQSDMPPVADLDPTTTEPTDRERVFIDGAVILRQALARHISTQELYRQFQDLARSDAWIAGFESLLQSAHPAARWIQNLAIRFRSADVSDLLINHTKAEIGQIRGDQGTGYSISQTAEVLREYRKQRSFKHDLLWAISHPMAWYHSLVSKVAHEQYDGHEANPTYSVGTVGDVKLIIGPTPVNDPVYDRIFLKGAHELRSNIMDVTKSHEAAWIDKLEKTAKESKGHLEHLTWGFVTKEKKGFLEENKLDSLLSKYKKAILSQQECGVRIPAGALSQDEIEKAFSHATKLLKGLNPNLKEKTSRHAALVVADTMMTLAATLKFLKKNPKTDGEPVHLAIACKQCFDRGPVYFAAFSLFYRSLTNAEALNENEFYQIVGLPLFRAPLNEGREQIEAKFKVYESLAHMIGSKTGLLATYTRALKSDLESLG